MQSKTTLTVQTENDNFCENEIKFTASQGEMYCLKPGQIQIVLDNNDSEFDGIAISLESLKSVVKYFSALVDDAPVKVATPTEPVKRVAARRKR